MSTTFLRRAISAFAIMLALAPEALAQDSATLARELDPLGRLDARTRNAVEILLDSAQLAGLPVAPLKSRALEGIAKRADGRRILFQVRTMFHALRDSRGVLGPQATADELNAAAGVLRVGVTTDQLAHLARTRDEKTLTVPLVVLGDLITRGVPREAASQTILQLRQRGAADDDFLGLWRAVERDIVSGTAPGVALLNRAREIPSREPPPVAAPSARPEI